MSSHDKLLNSIHEASELLRGCRGPVAVLTHYDADGLAAGGVMARLLASMGVPFVVRVCDALDEASVASLMEIDAERYVVMDLGSDIAAILRAARARGRSPSSILVIDHHKLPEEGIWEEVTLVNPELYGIDGGRYACASVTAALMAYYASGESDPYHLQLGIVGGVGDMQLQEGAEGINGVLVRLAVEAGVVEQRRDFVFFLNRKLPIYRAITWVFVPYIPRFSGRDDVGLNIVEKAGIPRERGGREITVGDLTPDEKERLLNTILEYIASLGVRISAEELVRLSYVFPREDADILSTAEDFMTLLSALGRMDRAHDAVLIASGARGEVLARAIGVLEERRRLLREFLEAAIERAEVHHGSIVVIDFRDLGFNPRMSGSVSTILSRSPVYRDKIVAVICRDREGRAKISTRAPRGLVDRGLNLARAMARLARRLGGVGGGHNVAAGATVEDSERLKEELVGELAREVEAAGG